MRQRILSSVNNTSFSTALPSSVARWAARSVRAKTKSRRVSNFVPLLLHSINPPPPLYPSGRGITLSLRPPPLHPLSSRSLVDLSLYPIRATHSEGKGLASDDIREGYRMFQQQLPLAKNLIWGRISPLNNRGDFCLFLPSYHNFNPSPHYRAFSP